MLKGSADCFSGAYDNILQERDELKKNWCNCKHKLKGIWDFPGGAVGRNLPAKQRTWVHFLVREETTCLGETKLLYYDYCACAPESPSLQTTKPANFGYWGPHALEPALCHEKSLQRE